MTTALGAQFTPGQDRRIAAAQKIPAEQRRLASQTLRRQAARSDANHWAITLDHSSHDDLKQGVLARSQSHVILSRDEYPDPMEAEQAAYLMGHARGTYPTKVSHAVQ